MPHGKETKNVKPRSTHVVDASLAPKDPGLNPSRPLFYQAFV